MNESLGVPMAVLREWAGRWRYPELAAALNDLRTTSGAEIGLTGLLLRGLASPCDPVETAARFIDDGRFDLAAELLDENTALPAADIVRLQQELAAARRQHAADRTRQLIALRERLARARAADTDAVTDAGGADHRRILDRLPRPAPGLDPDPADALEAVEAAEDRVKKALSERLDQLLEAGDAGGEAMSAWEHVVRTCIEGRAFPAARELLDAGPAQFAATHDDALPHLLAPLPGAWGWPGSTLEQIVGHYRRTPPPSWAGFTAWIPPRDDIGAWAVLDAMAALEAGVTADKAVAFAVALERAVDVEGQAAHATAAEATSEGLAGLWTVLGPVTSVNAEVLPRLAGVLNLWVGTQPPQGETPGTAPTLWFLPRTTASGPAPRGVARIDGALVLRLIAPDRRTGKASDPAVRRIHFLRSIGTRLRLSETVGSAATPAQSLIRVPSGPGARHRLAWLLYFLGFVVDDEPVLDLILHDTGGHAAVLRALLEALEADASGHAIRRIRVDAAALDRIRTSPRYLSAALSGLTSAIADDPLALKLLRIASENYADDPDTTFTAADLKEWLELLDEAVDVTSNQLDRSIDKLLDRGLFERRADTRMRLPTSGLRALLQQTLPIDSA